MKKKINIIQINGIKGLILTIGAVMCLGAGFIVFPGLIMEFLWNALSAYTGLLPKIALLQGILLWGILVLGYFVFVRKGHLIQFKSAADLSEEELDEVMEQIHMDYRADMAATVLPKLKELEKQLQDDLKEDGTEAK